MWPRPRWPMWQMRRPSRDTSGYRTGFKRDKFPIRWRQGWGCIHVPDSEICHLRLEISYPEINKPRPGTTGRLDEKTVLIVHDWAMKFLPQRYRESQADWFGRREISWHISIVYRRLGGVFQWQGFIHIVQSCKQDSSAVVGIMQDVLRTIKSENDEIEKAYFRQDNAGSYHSSSTILRAPWYQPALVFRSAVLAFLICKEEKVPPID